MGNMGEGTSIRYWHSREWELGFLMIMIEVVTLDRQYDHEKPDEAGFHEEQDIMEAYTEVFHSLEAAKMIAFATGAKTKR
jgi:hypothetical protein